MACDAGMNAAVAYLVLARGTGFDHCTTAWSKESIHKYGGMTWRQADEAVKVLLQAKLLEQTHIGSRPRYKLLEPGGAPERIWLPNEIVTAVQTDTSPICRLRQTGDVDA